MLRKTLTAQRKTRTGFGSRLALAAALVSGAAMGAAGMATPAMAQQQAEAEYSEPFVEAYQPVAEIAGAESGDFAAAKAQLPGVIAAAQTADDRLAAGQLSLQLGTKLSDRALQRQGLEMMLQSGKLPPDQVGQFQFLVGNLAYEAQDYAAAKTALQAAVDAGFAGEGDPYGLLIESYFKSNDVQGGLDFLQREVASRQAAGQPVPANWLLRGLQVAYENQLAGPATDISALLVSTNPSEQNWLNALQVVRALNQFENDGALDILRLQRLTGALDAANDYAQYVTAADARRNANEVLAVIEEGTAAGVIPAGDQFFAEQKQVAEGRAATDREEVPTQVGEARSASNGVTANGLGDAFMSFDDFANAEEMYQVALEKGGLRNREATLTRLGIAQARQSKFAEAKQSFEQVSGSREPIAEMWAAWVDAQGATATGG